MRLLIALFIGISLVVTLGYISNAVSYAKIDKRYDGMPMPKGYGLEKKGALPFIVSHAIQMNNGSYITFFDQHCAVYIFGYAAYEFKDVNNRIAP